MPRKPDFSAKQASRMTPKQILAEIRKGKTVTGFDPMRAEHLGNGKLKDTPIRKLDKDYERKGTFDFEGTLSRRMDLGGFIAGFRGKGPTNNYSKTVPIRDQMHPAAYRALLHKEAKRQGLI